MKSTPTQLLRLLPVATSLTILIAVLAIWAQSYWFCDIIPANSGVTVWDLSSWDGQASLRVVRYDHAIRSTVRRFRPDQIMGMRRFGLASPSEGCAYQYAGFGLTLPDEPVQAGGAVRIPFEVAVPYWFITLFPFSASVYFLIRIRRAATSRRGFSITLLIKRLLMRGPDPHRVYAPSFGLS